jgi:Resolvase, N terminal domain
MRGPISCRGVARIILICPHPNVTSAENSARLSGSVAFLGDERLAFGRRSAKKSHTSNCLVCATRQWPAEDSDKLQMSPTETSFSQIILNTLDTIARKGVGFKSLADAWVDTTTPHGRLMVTILGGLAEFERDLIKARTDDGRRRAMANGKRFGRKPKLTTHQIAEAIRRRDVGAASSAG